MPKMRLQLAPKPAGKAYVAPQTYS